MQQIRAEAYKALMTSDVVVYPQSLLNSMNDTVDGTPVTYKGYIYEDTEKVLNDEGTEVLSHLQIYMRGIDVSAIDIHSLISCADALIVKQRLISRSIYRGRDGAKVIGVLYLP